LPEDCRSGLEGKLVSGRGLLASANGEPVLGRPTVFRRPPGYQLHDGVAGSLFTPMYEPSSRKLTGYTEIAKCRAWRRSRWWRPQVTSRPAGPPGWQDSIPGGRANVLENHVDAALVGDAANFVANFFVMLWLMVWSAPSSRALVSFFVGAGSGDHAPRQRISRSWMAALAYAAPGAEHQHVFAGGQLGAGRVSMCQAVLEDPAGTAAGFLERDDFPGQGQGNSLPGRGTNSAAAAGPIKVPKIGG